MLDQVRDAIRLRQYRPCTDERYVQWIRRFVLYHGTSSVGDGRQCAREDLHYRRITVLSDKGNKDRLTALPGYADVNTTMIYTHRSMAATRVW
ncbi:MAG: phage integrase N-terminal SAM-like domain-containing protein [Sulfuricaulis sp.]